jgi:hypothetical protein
MSYFWNYTPDRFSNTLKVNLHGDVLKNIAPASID